ncbi:hypothetical protein PN462_19725 [Spirulina sp. CS-785/01]|nr:hypothetical protein [Spirulina sp. CS-785/01]MDB9315355.1 hypothetical protein [Spirulina sp. CS-785/01]
MTTVTDNQIQLTWQDNSDNETEFILERSQDQSNWTVIANLSANITEYLDSNTGFILSMIPSRDKSAQSNLAISIMLKLPYNNNSTSTKHSPQEKLLHHLSLPMAQLRNFSNKTPKTVPMGRLSPISPISEQTLMGKTMCGY